MFNLLASLLISLSASKPIDTSATYKKYFAELEALSLQIVNPETSDATRRILVQSLKTDIEILNELSQLASLVEGDLSMSTLNHPLLKLDSIHITWRKLSLRTLKYYGPDEVTALIQRLKHRDSAVQTMALMNLQQRLRNPMPLSLRGSPSRAESLQADELTETFNNLYEKSRAVEPAFLAAMKNKKADREIAADISRQLRESLANQ